MQQALGSSLEMFEIGNEPDSFSYWNRRPSSWNISDYVTEWLAAQEVVVTAVSSGSRHSVSIPYFAPSMAGTDAGGSSSSIGPVPAFADGLDSQQIIKEVSGHKYAQLPRHGHQRPLRCTS